MGEVRLISSTERRNGSLIFHFGSMKWLHGVQMQKKADIENNAVATNVKGMSWRTGHQKEIFRGLIGWVMLRALKEAASLFTAVLLNAPDSVSSLTATACPRLFFFVLNPHQRIFSHWFWGEREIDVIGCLSMLEIQPATQVHDLTRNQIRGMLQCAGQHSDHLLVATLAMVWPWLFLILLQNAFNICKPMQILFFIISICWVKIEVTPVWLLLTNELWFSNQHF